MDGGRRLPLRQYCSRTLAGSNFHRLKKVTKTATRLRDYRFSCIFAAANDSQTHGVIGNTTDFGSVVQGSSPCGSTKLPKQSTLRWLLFLFRVLAFESD